MRHHRELFESVRKYTGMYVIPETYHTVSALVLGYDLAYEGGVLEGFREWLQLRGARGSNLAWYALVLMHAFPGVAAPEAELTSAAAHRHAIDTLFDLIAEFDDARAKPGGLSEILVAYHKRMHRDDHR